MALAKTIRSTNGYQLVELSEDDKTKAIGEAISKNVRLFHKVLSELHRYILQNGLESVYEREADIALAIFEAISLKNGTVIETALKKKFSGIKENGRG
jgi:hypothetical protein